MSLDVIIPPKWEAAALAHSFEIKKLTETDTLVLHVFCDGSFKRKPLPAGGIGIVANIWLPRNTMKQRISKACFIPCSFRDDDDNNITEAFALAEGALVALERIVDIQSRFPTSCRPTDRVEIIFWSDSQTVLAALEGTRRVRSPSKMRHLLDIIKLKTQELYESSADVSVRFYWCPEQCVESHKQADGLSKKARITGSGSHSRALALFNRVSHREILSAFGRSRGMCPSTIFECHASSLDASSASIANAAEISAPESARPSTANPRQHPSLDLDPRLRAITQHPVIVNVLYRAAGTYRFFGLVGGMVECLPSELRSIMQEAIRDQQDLNKTLDYYAQSPSDRRKENHQLSTAHQYPNLFTIIELAASRLPADHQEKVLTAIKLQKEANAHLIQHEVVGHVYQFEDSNGGDMDHEREAVEESDALEDLMSLKETEVAEESAGIIGDPDVIEEPAKIIEEHKLPEAKIFDEPMDLDKPEVLDKHNIIDEPKADEPKADEQPIDIMQEPKIFKEPEIVEEVRPNRMQAIWAWVGRKLSRL